MAALARSASVGPVAASSGVAQAMRAFANMYMPNFRSGMAARFDKPKDAAHSPREKLKRIPTTVACNQWSAVPLTEAEEQAKFRQTVMDVLHKTPKQHNRATPERLAMERSFRMSQGVMDGLAERAR